MRLKLAVFWYLRVSLEKPPATPHVIRTRNESYVSPQIAHHSRMDSYSTEH